MTEGDAQDEVIHAELYDQHAEQAISGFLIDRSRAYFSANPDVAEPAYRLLSEARRVLTISAPSSLALSSAAAEVGVKHLFVRPLVSGLTHSEAVAPLLADIAVKVQGFDRLKGLLFALLREHGSLDLERYKRQGSTKLLWDEIKSNVGRRNALLHRGDLVTAVEAQAAIQIAEEVLGPCFSTVVTSMGFHLHEHRICSEFHLPAEFASLVAGV